MYEKDQWDRLRMLEAINMFLAKDPHKLSDIDI